MKTSYIDSLPPFERYERQVIDSLIEVMEITNGDAQGIAEVNSDIISEGFRDEEIPQTVAQVIANMITDN